MLQGCQRPFFGFLWTSLLPWVHFHHLWKMLGVYLKSELDAACLNLFQEQEAANNLLDGDPDTFWESDGSLGRHYIRLHMKPNVIIQYGNLIYNLNFC